MDYSPLPYNSSLVICKLYLAKLKLTSKETAFSYSSIASSNLPFL